MLKWIPPKQDQVGSSEGCLTAKGSSSPDLVRRIMTMSTRMDWGPPGPVRTYAGHPVPEHTNTALIRGRLVLVPLSPSGTKRCEFAGPQYNWWPSESKTLHNTVV